MAFFEEKTKHKKNKTEKNLCVQKFFQSIITDQYCSTLLTNNFEKYFI